MVYSTLMSSGYRRGRRGTVLPVLSLLIVALVGFLALAIDVGMVAVAKTQTQQAADLAALTAARTLNGVSTNNYNQTQATTNAQNILSYNSVLTTAIGASQLTLTYGTYDYNQTTQTFNANYPGTAGMPTTAVTSTVTSNSLTGAFSVVFGNSLLPSLTATAEAVHRPRDIALVMDLSGSMRMGTCLGFDFYTTSRSSNNPDSLYPTFGHYSSTSSAGMQGPSTNQTSADDSYTISPSNTTASNSSYSLTYINNFYQNAAYATTLVRAFDSYTGTNGGTTWTAPSASATPQLPSTTYATTPGGDVPLFKLNSTTTYATDVKDVLNTSTTTLAWELDGYSNYTNGTLSNAASGQSNYSNAPFNGYTQGPGYYGVTFFIWPPDPRTPLTTTNDSTQIGWFLTSFGYSGSPTSKTGDFSGTKGTALLGVYNSNSQTGSHNWPWPNDSGSSLSKYLTTYVYIPGGSRLLKTTDSYYQQIMRLYNWNYVVDNVGTTPCDWRLRFFGTTNNSTLFSSSGKLNTPGSSSYTVNYNEILRWIANGPNPFPSQLRAGRIKYYGSIPTAITGTWPSYGSTDQRFWVEFIDYVLGFRQTSAGVYTDVSGQAGYGSDFTFGTASISSQSSSGTPYMTYTDNPLRPKMRYWFGPMMMVDYMQNYNVDCNVSNYYFIEPGDSYEAPLYTAKEAYVAAVSTMQTNHPNDWVSIIPYSLPRQSASDTTGRFNGVSCPLGTNYPYATSALLFPFSTINADGSANQTEVTPYDADASTGNIPSANFLDTPRAGGDTCFAMALMLAYNQFAVTPTSDTTLRGFTTSSPITFPTGMAGGLGRKGAQKVVIFETDGLANSTATASLVTNGTYSYYKILYNMNAPSSSQYPTVAEYDINNSTVLNQVYSLVQQLASTYSTTRSPFRLYAIGFGPVFSGVNATSAEQTLQYMQYYAGTQSSASTALSSYQIVTGTDAQMSANMVSAFTTILENGVQVALIK